MMRLQMINPFLRQLDPRVSHTLRYLSAIPRSQPVMEEPRRALSFDEQLRRERAHVRTRNPENYYAISFRFCGTPATGTWTKSRIFNFNRTRTDTLGPTLERMSHNLGAKISRKMNAKAKKKRKTESPQEGENEPVPDLSSSSATLEESVKVVLKDKGDVMAPETSNELAWREGAKLYLDDMEYDVCVDYPTILSGKMTKVILPEFPVDATLNFENADADESIFVWLKQKTHPRSSEPYSKDDFESATGGRMSLSTITAGIEDLLKPCHVWEIAAVDRNWIPQETDVGLQVALVCYPVKQDLIGEPILVVAKNPVTDALPKPIPFLRRHEACRTRPGKNQFRIMTYNLLADQYADQESSFKDLFPYCKPEFIHSEYRRQVTLRELIGYHADILCLQEMDIKLFKDYYAPQLRRMGYQGLLCEKQPKGVGIATFFRSEKFRLLAQHDIDISKHLFEDSKLEDLWDVIKDKDKLATVLKERSNLLQVTVLEDVEDPSRTLVVANTHLWFRPEFPRVRLIQMAVSLRHLEHVIDQIKNSSRNPTVILCGDFNSSPGWGVHHFINGGKVAEDFPEWKMFTTEEQEYAELTLHHPFKLYNTCGELPFTNFVPNFKAAIDWIYADSDALETVSVIPMPTEEELSRFIAIPSAVFPSDHIAVGCDLQWKDSR